MYRTGRNRAGATRPDPNPTRVVGGSTVTRAAGVVRNPKIAPNFETFPHCSNVHGICRAIYHFEALDEPFKMIYSMKEMIERKWRIQWGKFRSSLVDPMQFRPPMWRRLVPICRARWDLRIGICHTCQFYRNREIHTKDWKTKNINPRLKQLWLIKNITKCNGGGNAVRSQPCCGPSVHGATDFTWFKQSKIKQTSIKIIVWLKVNRG